MGCFDFCPRWTFGYELAYAVAPFQDSHPIDMSDPILLTRLEHANALLKIIAQNGRQFFYSKPNDRVARFDLARGQLHFWDDYTGYPIALPGNEKDWQMFSHGGTLRSLVELLADYIVIGQVLHLDCIAPDFYSPSSSAASRDLWGYGIEAAAATRQAAFELPMFKRGPTPA